MNPVTTITSLSQLQTPSARSYALHLARVEGSDVADVIARQLRQRDMVRASLTNGARQYPVARSL